MYLMSDQATRTLQILDIIEAREKGNPCTEKNMETLRNLIIDQERKKQLVKSHAEMFSKYLENTGISMDPDVRQLAEEYQRLRFLSTIRKYDKAMETMKKTSTKDPSIKTSSVEPTMVPQEKKEEKKVEEIVYSSDIVDDKVPLINDHKICLIDGFEPEHYHQQQHQQQQPEQKVSYSLIFYANIVLLVILLWSIAYSRGIHVNSFFSMILQAFNNMF